ncbi:MAG: hypothetical protein AB1941_17590 [Gemmatimonadota bacterium]
MRTRLLLLLAAVLPSLAALPALAGQTRGIGDVLLVESKAAKIESHRDDIPRQRQEAERLDAAWEERIRRLRDELSGLRREMDGHLHDLRMGYYCSECGRSKTQLENQGINFAAHLRDVRGRAVPASQARLDRVRQEYMDRISRKQAEIAREAGGDRQAASKRRAVADMEAAIPRLCAEITQHGRSYETKVVAEAKSDQEDWAATLMSHVSSILIAEDRIAIYEARLRTLDRGHARAAEEARERVRRDTQGRQERLEEETGGLKAGLERLRAETEAREAELEARAGALRGALSAAEATLRRTDLSQEARDAATAEEARLRRDLEALQRSLQELRARLEAESTRVSGEVERLRGESLDLARSLPRLQEEAVAGLKASTDQRVAATRALIAAAQATVQTQTAMFQAKSDLFRGRVVRYQALVAEESNRMLAAGSRVGCPVPNDARGAVMLHWNKLYPCVSAHLKSKPRTENVFGSYCTGESSTLHHLGEYRQFLAGLDPDELQVVRNGSNPTWLERVTSP